MMVAVQTVQMRGQNLVTGRPVGSVFVWDRAVPPDDGEDASDISAHAWIPVPYAVVSRVFECCGPAYGDATFYRNYGELIREDRTTWDQWLPMRLEGRLVKIVVPAQDDLFPPVVWYGVIDQARDELLGNAVDVPTGRQIFTCYGLLRLFDRTVFEGFTYAPDPNHPDDVVEIPGAARPFNLHRAWSGEARGNRSETTTAGTYVFASQPTLAAEWTAWEAVQYLLAHHAPRVVGTDGEPAAVPALFVGGCTIQGPYLTENPDDPTGAKEVLSWWRIGEETRGRTVKELLDLLIPRTRGVGYWLEYVPVKQDGQGYADLDENDNPRLEVGGRLVLHVFTVAESDLLLADEHTIPANPAQVHWDFENDPAVASTSLAAVETMAYDTIIVSGRDITTTATWEFDPEREQVEKYWTDLEQESFLKGAKEEDGYDELDPAMQAQRNAERRSGDLLRGVFQTWRLRPDWDKTVSCSIQGTRQKFAVYPKFDDAGKPRFAVPADADPAEYTQAFWVYGTELLGTLRIPAGWDVSGDRLNPLVPEEDQPARNELPRQGAQPRPMVFGESPWSDGETYWERLDQSYWRVPFEPTSVRQWTVGLDFEPGWPNWQLVVSGAPQQMLGKAEWSAPDPDAPEADIRTLPARTDPAHDPRRHGIDWKTIQATATLSLGVPLRAVRYTRFGAPVRRPERVLRIEVPDAGLDFLVPWTIVDVKDGAPVRTSTGGLLRDDRKRIAAIADAAALWYGRERRILTVVRNRLTVPGALRLGTLVVRIGLYYGAREVGTPITGYEVDVERGTVTWTTSWVEVDLV